MYLLQVHVVYVELQKQQNFQYQYNFEAAWVGGWVGGLTFDGVKLVAYHLLCNKGRHDEIFWLCPVRWII